MLRLLHQYGADPLILNSHNQSSLHIASASNRLSIVKELLSLTGSSLLEIQNDHGQTALSVTTNIDIVNELITFGADISSLDNNNMNVLMIAVLKDQLPIVEHLLFAIDDQSTNIFDQVTKRNNRSIFLIAVQTGSIDMCSVLFTHPYVRWDTIDKQRLNAFHIAARHNHHKLIEFFCEQIRKSDKLASLKSRSYSRTTTDVDLTNIFQPSLALRLYIDAQTEDGKTPLHLAAEQGHTLCIKMLLKYGADVLLTNYFGQLALHAAIQNGSSECVELLIKSSIRNMTDFQYVLSRKQSPLITACCNGFVDIVRLLLSENIGIDIDDNNKQQENPLEIAIKYRQIETIHVLLEHSYSEYWLMSIRETKHMFHQTPLRDMIRYIPECAEHVFNKLIVKTNETDRNGNTFEKTTYNYKYIDDYFM
jgi:ankyrin repeat protein